MADATFTFRVEGELKERFAQAAKAKDRTGAQLLRDFMRDFVRDQAEAVAHDAWFRREVAAGRSDAEAGNLVPAEEIEAEFAERRARTKARFAGRKS